MMSSQPCIRFLMHLITYFAFVCLIIASRFEYIKTEKENKLFSILYPKQHKILKSHIENKTFDYHSSDFYIRNDRLNKIDKLILVWIIG